MVTASNGLPVGKAVPWDSTYRWSTPTAIAMADLVFLFGFWVAVLVTAELTIRLVLGLAGGVIGALGSLFQRPWRRFAV